MEFYYDSVDKDVLILSVDGGLLQQTAERFVGELEHYLELGVDKLIVDCSRLKTISSYGLGILVSLHRRLAKKGGDVKFAAVSGFVGKVFEKTGLGEPFQIYPTVEAARLAFDADRGDDPQGPSEPDSRHPQLDRS
jgi:anti-anti-sigma factor